MTIGKKFLERVLNEGKDKDVDGFKDDFNITTLSATSPAVANLPMPMARQVVQLYHLLGVSAETLESRPKAIKEAAMAVADEMRTNRPLRLAAQRLFTALATAKGFARKEDKVMEASDLMATEKDVNLIGSSIVKQIEAVLAALKMPSGVLQRAMRRDQQALMDTASIIQRGVVRSKFAMLASELGVDLMSVGRTVKVEEAAPMGTYGTVSTGYQPQSKAGIDAFHAAAGNLMAELGLDISKLPNAKMMDTKMKIAQRGDAFNTRAIRMMTALTNLLRGNNR